MSELVARIERIRSASRLSGEYWVIRDRDNVERYVYLSPPGDIARVRLHYPGANGQPVSRQEWMARK